MKTRFQILFLVCLSVLSCQDKLSSSGEESSLGKATEDACGFVQNAYGARVSWKNNIPVTISVDPQFAQEFYSVAESAAEIWNSSFGKKMIVISKMADSESLIPAQDLNSGLYWRTDWPVEKANQQALTTIFFKSNLISEADVKINAKDFNFYSGEPNSNRQIHMESLLVHEFGHFLGLRHTSIANSVMWPTLAPITIRNVISQEDLQSLRCEYK